MLLPQFYPPWDSCIFRQVWGSAFWNSVYKTTLVTYRKGLIPMEERIKGIDVALEQMMKLNMSEYIMISATQIVCSSACRLIHFFNK